MYGLYTGTGIDALLELLQFISRVLFTDQSLSVHRALLIYDKYTERMRYLYAHGHGRMQTLLCYC